MKLNIKDIKLNEHNPRDITPEMFEKLKKSIQEFPQMLETRPLVIDENNVVLGGNMRLRALTDLGYEEIPVQKVEGWSEEQKKEFVVKDNLSYGVWDWELLANSWDAEQLTEWGLEFGEWKNEEKELQAEEDNFIIPNEDDIHTEIEYGDIFQIGEHRLMCGDSTKEEDLEKLINKNDIDMVFTDPPYGVDYKSKKLGGIMNDKLKGDSLYQFIYDAFYLVQKYTKNNTAFYCWYEDKYRDIFQYALQDAGLQYKSNLIWNKGMNLSGADYQKAHENCLYMQKKNGKAQWYGERDKKTILGARRKDLTGLSKDKLIKMLLNMQDTSTVWDLDRDNVTTYNHPTQKPITLSGRAILNSTPPNTIVLDIFLGSGSTMVASHQLNRKCYGMELDPKYCQVIIDRMQKLDPNITITKL